MLLIKSILVISTVFTVAAAQGLIDPNDYLVEAAKRSGRSVQDIETTLTNNGAKAQIDAALAQSQADNNLRDGISCDPVACSDCAQCNTDRTDLSIEIAAAWAICAIACAIIVECPAAIALATSGTAALCAKFCNDHGQPIACDLTCDWATCGRSSG